MVLKLASGGGKVGGKLIETATNKLFGLRWPYKLALGFFALLLVAALIGSDPDKNSSSSVVATESNPAATRSMVQAARFKTNDTAVFNSAGMCAPDDEGFLGGSSGLTDAIRAAQSGDKEALAGLMLRGKIWSVSDGTPVAVITYDPPRVHVRMAGGYNIGQKCWTLEMMLR